MLLLGADSGGLDGPALAERLRNPAGLWYAGLGAADVIDGLILYQKKIPLV